MARIIPSNNTIKFLESMVRPITSPNMSHTEMAWAASRAALLEEAKNIFEQENTTLVNKNNSIKNRRGDEGED